MAYPGDTSRSGDGVEIRRRKSWRIWAARSSWEFFNGLLEQFLPVCSGSRPIRPAGFTPARPYQSECAAGGRYGAL